jgi:arsenite-transporting ATPase
LLQQRAVNELAQIELVSMKHAKRWAVVPLMAEEPVGVERLRQLARH